MAYSRWGSSIWYTYWAASSLDSTFKWPTKELKNAQVFHICDYPSYSITYGELKEKGGLAILKDVVEFYSKSHPVKLFKDFDSNGEVIYEDTMTEPKNITKSDLSELSYYFQQFIEDIDQHFELGTFLMHEWYYPIRNKISWKIKSFIRSLRNDS
jgi:hypothetical protein